MKFTIRLFLFLAVTVHSVFGFQSNVFPPSANGGGGGGGYVYTGVLSGIPATCVVSQIAFITNATPGQNQYNCTATNVWTQNLNSGAGGASIALDNLVAPSINTTLLPQTGVALGSTTKPFSDLYLYLSGIFGTNYAHFTGTPTGARAITVPDANSTLVVPDTGASNNYISAISADGAITKSRPACGTLSDSTALCITAPAANVAAFLAAPSGTNFDNALTTPVPLHAGGTNCAAPYVINPQTTTYQVVAADFTCSKTITIASGTFTVTLVASGTQPVAGSWVKIINYGTGVVTIARSGQNINGGTASLTLTAGSATAPTTAQVWSDGTNYFGAITVPIGGSGCTPIGTAGVVQATNGAGICQATSITDDGSAVVTTEPLTAQSFTSSDTSHSGLAQFKGVTSGEADLAAADIAGTAIVYVLPSTNGAAGQLLSDSGVTTCPTLAAGAPSTCHLLKWSTGNYIAGTSLTPGDAYYFGSGGLALAKADSSSTLSADCIAISTTQCLVTGIYQFGSSQSWTAGQTIYVSDATAGALVTTAPSTSAHFVQVVGKALANDTILWRPSPDVGTIQ